MNGREAILKKIGDNGEAKAKDLLKNARAEAEAIAADAAAKAKSITDAAAVSAKQKAALVYDNKMTMATRQAKNVVLSAKQAILDGLFAEAYDTLSKMPPAEYKKFLGELILRYAEDGDSIVPGKEDAKVFSADFVAGLATGKNKAKLTLSKDAAAFNKGVYLRNKNSDKNLSLEMLLRMARENGEAAVAKLCFEVK